MKYAFIQRHRRVWPITVQCRVREVSVSGYHAHIARQASTKPCRYLSDAALRVHIKAIHTQTRGSYGRPRIWHALRNEGVRVGKQRLQTLMHQHGIRARGKRRIQVTPDSNPDLPIAPNGLNRQFTVDVPRTRSGLGTSPTFTPMRAGCFWPWSSTGSAVRWWVGRCARTGRARSSSTRCVGRGSSVIRASKPV